MTIEIKDDQTIIYSIAEASESSGIDMQTVHDHIKEGAGHATKTHIYVKRGKGFEVWKTYKPFKAQDLSKEPLWPKHRK